LVKKTYVYIISFFALISTCELMAQKPKATEPPDTVVFPLAFRAGVDILGPVIYLTDKNNLTAEGYFSTDFDERRSLFIGGGYSNYKYSQYNYSCLTNGIFIKTGVDFNLLKPQTALGKYWAGIGLHYGISAFRFEIPELSQGNYWGTTTSSVPLQSHFGHFLEASPGFRARLFGNLTLGWSVSLRKMIYAGGGKDARPIYIPGYGLSAKTYSTGINYYIVWNFRYKTIKVLIQKEPPEEPDENTTPSTNTGSKNAQKMER
ncbi:MAG: DUF6048 family protein, partial [Bacteroidales bacterium]